MIDLKDIEKGLVVYNKKNSNRYEVLGFTTHSENLDLLVRYADHSGKEWSRPIGNFMVKYQTKKPIKMPYIPQGMLKSPLND